MEQTWRWYGPSDPVSLDDIRQSGATGVVTALHHIPNGEVWPESDILERKTLIEAKGLTWTVVESVPVHEDIKRHTGRFDHFIKNYARSLENLAKHGITTVCYNFMPVLDWTRTDLDYELPDGSRALRFDYTAYCAFDLFILKRPNAESAYTDTEIQAAQCHFESMNAPDIAALTKTILAGLPGAEESYSLESFRQHLASYNDIDKNALRSHLAYFLQKIIPACESHGVHLAIHPDDPPRPMFGLPRIVSTKEDIEWLLEASSSAHNGITMCTGSYGVRADNDLVNMIRNYGHRIYFAHLRSTMREDNPNSFYEAAHLNGDVDMYGVIKQIVEEEQRRDENGAPSSIPIRPDHGHKILDDLNKQTNPGYSAIGRLKGLAEIRGVELAIKRAFYSEASD